MMIENPDQRSKDEQMRAIAINRFGGVDELELKILPIPKVGPDEVFIRVHTAGIGVWDPKEREGYFAKMRGDENPNFPKILGRDASGTILGIGGEVTGFKEGDNVYVNGSPTPDANLYAEYATAKAEHIIPIPDNLSMEEAGALPVAAITALTGLDNILNIQPDEKLLIFGGSGGLGHLAVQLAKRMGAKVFAVASGEDGVELADKLGADASVNGRKENIIEGAKEFAPEGLDAAFLTSGGEVASQALHALRKGGRVAYPQGVSEPKKKNNLDIQAFSMKSDPEVYDKLNHLIEGGPFTVHIDQMFELEEAQEAHRKLGEHYLGKLAFKIA